MSSKGIFILAIIWLVLSPACFFSRKYCDGYYMAMCRSCRINHSISKTQQREEK